MVQLNDKEKLTPHENFDASSQSNFLGNSEIEKDSDNTPGGGIDINYSSVERSNPLRGPVIQPRDGRERNDRTKKDEKGRKEGHRDRMPPENGQDRYRERDRLHRERHQEYLRYRMHDKSHRGGSRERYHQHSSLEHSKYGSRENMIEVSDAGPGISHREEKRPRERSADKRVDARGNGSRDCSQERPHVNSARSFYRAPPRPSSRASEFDSRNVRPPLPPSKDKRDVANNNSRLIGAEDSSLVNFTNPGDKKEKSEHGPFVRGDGSEKYYSTSTGHNYPIYNTHPSRHHDQRYPDDYTSSRGDRRYSVQGGRRTSTTGQSRVGDDYEGSSSKLGSNTDISRTSESGHGGDRGYGTEYYRHRRDPVGEERSSAAAASLPPRPDSVTSYRTNNSRVTSMHGYPGYGDPYSKSGGVSRGGMPGDVYDPQHYYYYYYSRYYDQHPKYREYYNSMLKHYHQQYPASQPAASIPDERGSVRSGRSSVNDDLKKSTLSTSRTAAAAAPLYDPYGLYQHQPQHDTSSQFLSDFHERSSVGGGYEPSAIYPPRQGPLYRARSGDVSGRGSVDARRTPSQRLTPTLYSRHHTIAHFTTTGQIVMVVPPQDSSGYSRQGMESGQSSASVVKLVDVRTALAGNEEIAKELKIIEAFPGPLTRQDTHKDVVVRFCECKQRELTAELTTLYTRGGDSKRSIQLMSSRQLLWQFLSLLVKQNGKLCAADVAGLLVNSASDCKQREEDAALHDRGAAAAAQRVTVGMDRMTLDGRALDDDQEEEEEEEEDQDRAEEQERPSPQCTPALNIVIPLLNSIPQLTPEQLTAIQDEVTDLVCLGRRREAIDLAVRHKLWGHAMAIGSRMEQSVGSGVLTAFMHTLAGDDVVHTLVQQANGKRPEVTKSYSPHRWGDWRRHLATLVANASAQPTRDRQAVLALGDSLAGAGDTVAAHLCYLIGGGISVWGQKLQLLGRSSDATSDPLARHHHSASSSSLLDSIQCSEVYEYGLSLDTGGGAGAEQRLPGFEEYRLLYAATLAEYGYAKEAVRYCEELSTTATVSSPDTTAPLQLHYSHTALLSRLHHLASSLKYHHAHYQAGEGELHDIPDPDWLTLLHGRLYESEQLLLSLQQQEQEEEQRVAGGGEEEPMQQQSGVNDGGDAYAGQADYAAAAANGADGNANYGAAVPALAMDDTKDPQLMNHHQQAYDGNVNAVMHGNDSLQQNHQPVRDIKAEPVDSKVIHQQSSDDMSISNNNNNQQQQQQFTFQPMLGGNGYNTQQPDVGDGREQTDGGMKGYSSARPDYSKRESIGGEGGGDNSSAGGSSQPQSPHYTPIHAPHYSPAHAPHYPLQQQQQQFSAGEGPYSSLPASVAADEEEDGPLHAGWGYTSLPNSGGDGTGIQQQQQQPQTDSKSNNNNTDASKGSSNKNDDGNNKGEGADNKGFLSRIFGWKNNQAKLPDDKNPTIVWDEDRKRWVNTDGSEETTDPPPPPPTAATLPPLGTASRAGPRKSRYVNPVDEKDRVKPAATNTPPMPQQQQQQMMPLQQQQQMMPPQQQQQQMMPPQQQQQMMPPQQQQQMMPPQQQQQQMPLPQQQEHQSGYPVMQQPTPGQPMQETALAAVNTDEDDLNASMGQPMFFNPAQFQQQQQQQQGRGRGGAAANARRGRGGGPQRRAFGAGTAHPPPPPPSA